jgi:patatin-related protein
VPGAEKEELRIALAMTGGVSLAIWMGGVAHEVNRLLHRQSAWDPLLEVLDQHAVVDLVSGTSAGGLNGALLAAGIAGNRDTLSGLRQLWLDDGDLDALLRKVKKANPPSLMQGDEFFLPELRHAFDKLLPKGDNDQKSAMEHFSLFTTMTLMKGRPRRYVDALGVEMDELDHRGTMQFDGRTNSTTAAPCSSTDRCSFNATATRRTRRTARSSRGSSHSPRGRARRIRSRSSRAGSRSPDRATTTRPTTLIPT